MFYQGLAAFKKFSSPEPGIIEVEFEDTNGKVNGDAERPKFDIGEKMVRKFDKHERELMRCEGALNLPLCHLVRETFTGNGRSQPACYGFALQFAAGNEDGKLLLRLAHRDDVTGPLTLMVLQLKLQLEEDGGKQLKMLNERIADGTAKIHKNGTVA